MMGIDDKLISKLANAGISMSKSANAEAKIRALSLRTELLDRNLQNGDLDMNEYREELKKMLGIVERIYNSL